MKNVWTAVGALAAGAAVMALLDPEQGARRRAFLSRRVAMAAHEAADAMESAGRQAQDRLQVLAHEGRGALVNAVERLQDDGEDARGVAAQAVEHLQDAAQHGQEAGLRLLQRLQALAREGRSRLSSRLEREAPQRRQPGPGLALLTALSGMAVGAAAMFLLDPQQGRRRQALARDQARHFSRTATGFTEAGLRDLGHRARGLAAQAAGLMRRDMVDDVVLVQRVRSALGRVASHPHAIWVTAAAGCVTVGGPVLASERSALLQCVGSVHGVREVRDALELHESALHVPALQGGRTRSGPHAEYMQAHWAPGPRLLALAGGVALALYGASRRGLPGLLAGAAGAGLVLRAARNERLSLAMARVSLPHGQGAAQPALENGIARPAADATQAQTWSSAAPSVESRGGAPLH